MKFKCGLTEEEEKQKVVARLEANRILVEKGEVWFAWYPVQIEQGHCRWLEKVRRRANKVYLDFDDDNISVQYIPSYKKYYFKKVTEWKYEAL